MQKENNNISFLEENRSCSYFGNENRADLNEKTIWGCKTKQKNYMELL